MPYPVSLVREECFCRRNDLFPYHRLGGTFSKVRSVSVNLSYPISLVIFVMGHELVGAPSWTDVLEYRIIDDVVESE